MLQTTVISRMNLLSFGHQLVKRTELLDTGVAHSWFKKGQILPKFQHEFLCKKKNPGRSTTWKERSAAKPDPKRPVTTQNAEKATHRLFSWQGKLCWRKVSSLKQVSAATSTILYHPTQWRLLLCASNTLKPLFSLSSPKIHTTLRERRRKGKWLPEHMNIMP